jgi:hypothetical protein
MLRTKTPKRHAMILLGVSMVCRPRNGQKKVLLDAKSTTSISFCLVARGRVSMSLGWEAIVYYRFLNLLLTR